MSKEIELRTAQESDFSDFWEFCSNEEVSKYLTWDKYTDKDLAKSFFEEKMLKNTELPNVYLMILYQGRVYDTYFVSEAFINAVNNVNRVIFDKSGLVSKVLDVESKMDLDELVSIFINNISKRIYKAKGGKLEQVTRILGDIRNKSII